MSTTFLFTENKGLLALIKALEGECLENAKVFVDTDFMTELAKSADKECTVKEKIKEIIWEPKTFIDYEINKSEYGHRVYRINMESKNLFFDTNNHQAPSKIIVIQ